MCRSLEPLFSNIFAAVLVCMRSLLYIVFYKESPWRRISVLFASIFAIQTSKSLKNSKRTKVGLTVFLSGAVFQKILFHSQREKSGNSHRNFWSNIENESAHCCLVQPPAETAQHFASFPLIQLSRIKKKRQCFRNNISKFAHQYVTKN